MEQIDQILADLQAAHKISDQACARIMTLQSANDQLTAENAALRAEAAAQKGKMETVAASIVAYKADVSPKLAQLDKLEAIASESTKMQASVSNLAALLADKPLTADQK